MADHKPEERPVDEGGERCVGGCQRANWEAKWSAQWERAEEAAIEIAALRSSLGHLDALLSERTEALERIANSPELGYHAGIARSALTDKQESLDSGEVVDE